MRGTSPCPNYKNSKRPIGGSKGPISESTTISITECKGWGKDVDNQYFGKYMRNGDCRNGSNCDITRNSKPCWNLIFEKELGATLLIIGDPRCLGRGMVSNRQSTSCISPTKLEKQCSECSA
ncbi:hypothetical protein Peur_027223 [Populus x canadensis]